MQQSIPAVPIPRMPDDPEIEIDLNEILHRVYERARYDLRIDNSLPPVPRLDVTVDRWARAIL